MHGSFGASLSTPVAGEAMKRAVSYILAVLCVAIPVLNTRAQSMSHEEEMVRNAYAKLTFMCELVPVTHAAFDHKGKVDLAALNTTIAQDCPVFALSSFTGGPVSDIANESLGQFITLPTPHDQILEAHPFALSYNFSGNLTAWYGAKFEWKDSNSNGYPYDESLTVAHALQQKLLLWSDQTGDTLTSYAAYTVNATFQGKSTGPHHVIFFFGHDASGKEVTSPQDLISAVGMLHNIEGAPSYPGAFLSSDIRTVPVVAEWMRGHEMSATACSAAAIKTICCSGGHCGISQTDLHHDLSAPLPPKKTTGSGQ
jgi:hypothetical protein